MPSMINELVGKEVEELVASHPSALLVDPTGLKAEDSLAFRRKLHDVGAVMLQTKRRLIARSLPAAVRPHLEVGGSLAIIVGEDIAAAAKVVNDSVKAEKMVLRAGLIEGQAVDAAGAAGIASMPTKHQARALVVRALRAPAVRLAKVLRVPYVRLARAVNKHKDNQEKAAG